MGNGPIITLPPENPDLRRRLGLKLKEYEGRLQPYKAPEQQMGEICKIAVLAALLRDGQVVCWDLSRELYEKYGVGFDPRMFVNACGVIVDYITTGGVTVHGGTGLPA